MEHDHQSFGAAYSPSEMAHLVESVGVTKAALSLPTLLCLGVLAGVFIAFGAMFYTLVITGSTLGFGPTRLLGGIAFSLGLVLVVVGGAELFTGNNLIVMAFASGKVTLSALLRNWGVVYVANGIGALSAVYAMQFSGALDVGGGSVRDTAIAIATAKTDLSLSQAFVRGILCNALVCLAIWLCYASRRVSGKILAIILPISAFVALGFEHSIANMYLLPIGMLASGAGIDIGVLFSNLVPVTLGNIIGGSGGVALIYWLVYLRS